MTMRMTNHAVQTYVAWTVATGINGMVLGEHDGWQRQDSDGFSA
jgi:hypothetical protein